MSDSGPIFSDPSGQRRRLMKAAGVAGSLLLVGALVLVGLSLFGGPNTPLSVFVKPPSPAGRSGHESPGHAGSVSGTSAPRARSESPAPRPSPSGKGTGQSASPTPTNPAGKTPQGHRRSPSRHPHPSPSSTHAR